MSGDGQKYWGFISYSHRDRRQAEWLHKAIESYRVPARLAGTVGRHGTVPKKLFPIFRDRTELSAAGGLNTALQHALDQSRCLVIICSPAAAASRWVNEEILYFKRLGGEDRILCLIVDGEPGASAGAHPERECFPPALRFKLGADGALSDQSAEPLAADLREHADGRDGARLKILAGLLGVGLDDLKRRDLQTRNRRLAVLAGLSMAVSAAMAVLAVKAFVAQKAAERSRQQGEDLIGFMLGDLREKLEPLGKLEILDAVGDKAMTYFAQLDHDHLSEAALTARAKALRQIGDVRLQQGRAAEADAAAIAKDAASIEDCDNLQLSTEGSNDRAVRCGGLYLISIEAEPEGSQRSEIAWARLEEIVKRNRSKSAATITLSTIARYDYLKNNKNNGIEMLDALQKKGYYHPQQYLFLYRHCPSINNYKSNEICRLLHDFLSNTGTP